MASRSVLSEKWSESVVMSSSLMLREGCSNSIISPTHRAFCRSVRWLRNRSICCVASSAKGNATRSSMEEESSVIVG